jgi:hypothetical protein
MAEARIPAIHLKLPAMGRADGERLARQVAANLADRLGDMPGGRVGDVHVRLPAGTSVDPVRIAAAVARAVRGRLSGTGR